MLDSCLLLCRIHLFKGFFSDHYFLKIENTSILRHIKVVENEGNIDFSKWILQQRSGWSYFCQDRKGTNFNFINFIYVTVFNVAIDVALGSSGNRCGNCTSNTS